MSEEFINKFLDKFLHKMDEEFLENLKSFSRENTRIISEAITEEMYKGSIGKTSNFFVGLIYSWIAGGIPEETVAEVFLFISFRFVATC